MSDKETKEFDYSKMATAGDVALEEFDKIFEGMKPAEKRGAQLTVDWLAANYGKAGYKRLLSPKFNGLLTRVPRLNSK